MTFLVDAQLPPLLARALAQAGVDARHVDDFALREATDRQIWQYALEKDQVIVTKDFDFADRAAKTFPSPAIIWLRFGNCSNQYLIASVLAALPSIIRRLEMNDRLIEVA